MKKNANREQETGQGATHDHESLPGEMRNKVIDAYNGMILTMQSLSALMTALKAGADTGGFAAAERPHRQIAEARKALHPVLAKYADAVKEVKP